MTSGDLAFQIKLALNEDPTLVAVTDERDDSALTVTKHVEPPTDEGDPQFRVVVAQL